MRPDASIQMTIPSRLDCVWMLGVAAKAISMEVGLDKDTAWYMELAVVEAANNAIKHAYEERPGHEVEVSANLEHGMLLFRVSDSGRAMTDSPSPSLEVNPEDIGSLPEGGMGFFLMAQVMDRIEYSSQGDRNTLTLAKRLDAA